MKTKNLVIIFILFLLIALASGLVVFLNKEKNEALVDEPVVKAEKQAEPAFGEPAEATATAPEKVATPQSPVPTSPQPSPFKGEGDSLVEEKIKAVMIIDGFKFEAEIKPDSSAYDLMSLLKAENKINFSGKNYSGLGFFVEAINGLKNNPLGKNWIYYVNGRPAPVGVSNYQLKENDVVEWKYEEKSF